MLRPQSGCGTILRPEAGGDQPEAQAQARGEARGREGACVGGGRWRVTVGAIRSCFARARSRENESLGLVLAGVG